MSEWTRPAQPVRCKVDLTAPLTVRRERGVLVQGDENANAIVAEVYQANGAPYDLTGATVTLTFVRPDRLAAPPIAAEITGENHNIAVATLTDTCYRHSGQYAASLKLHRGETERTIVRLIGEIISTGHDGTVDDEQLFPTPEELLETLEKVETARQNAETAASRANTAAARAEQLTIDASGLAGDALKLGGHEPEYFLPASAAAGDSNRLGGQRPAYYARQSDVDALKAGVEIVPSANGNVIALTDTSDRPFRGLTVYGKTTQNGTPTPAAPVELVTAGADGVIEVGVPGKNLLKASAGLKAETRNGVTFTPAFDANGELVSVTVNGTAAARTDYIILSRQNGPGWMSQFHGMTVIGSGCPAGGSSVAADGLYALSFQGFEVSGNAAVDTGNGTRHITVADEVGTFDPVQVYIIIFAGCTAKNLVFEPMIRRADESSSAFESYRAQTLPLSAPNGLPGIPVTSVGNYTDAKGQQWVCDEIDLERGVRIQRVKLMTINGSENWVVDTSTNLAYINTEIMDTAIDRSYEVLCTAFATSTRGELPNKPYHCCIQAIYPVFMINNTGVGSTVDAVKNYFAENPATVLYQLNQPIEIPLTAEELSVYRAMHTNHPNTTVFNDSGADMMVRYVADKDLFFDAFEKRVLAKAAAQTAAQTAALEDAYQEGVNEA